MISVPVYNRREYLEITAKSLYECSNINKTAVKVFNDCNSEFDNNYLRKLFNKPNAEIINREKNLRADRNTYQGMLDFLNTSNDVLFICDADLLLRPDTIDYIFSSFKRTDGFLGLYNSELHRDIYFDGEFVYKENVGFAGICISRSILRCYFAINVSRKAVEVKNTCEEIFFFQRLFYVQTLVVLARNQRCLLFLLFCCLFFAKTFFVSFEISVCIFITTDTIL